MWGTLPTTTDCLTFMGTLQGFLSVTSKLARLIELFVPPFPGRVVSQNGNPSQYPHLVTIKEPTKAKLLK